MRRRVASVLAMVGLSFGGAAYGQLPGDLDADGEVNLPDLVTFVGCLSGPNGVAGDPACDPADFDPDTDIDLRDFAGLQRRFGFGQGPPQIISFTPAPGSWVVDDVGLTEVTIGFSEPVVVPDDSVEVWLVAGNDVVTGLTTSYDADTFVLTVTFAEPLRDDRVTVVVDYTIEDVAGNPLDGEIAEPRNAVLPSGNDVNGGQGVFRVRVLQGDANRDGVVDAADVALVDEALGLCRGDVGFDERADLDDSGCVDMADSSIVTDRVGKQLLAGDGTSPAVDSVEARSFLDYYSVYVRFSEQVNSHAVHRRACFLRRPNGELIPSFAVEPNGFSNALEFIFMEFADVCVGLELNIGNGVPDFSGELLVLPEPMPCP